MRVRDTTKAGVRDTPLFALQRGPGAATFADMAIDEEKSRVGFVAR